MSLIDYINVDAIMLDVQESDKETLLSKMLERLDSCDLLENREGAENAIMAREQLMSTGVGNGVAIPHAKTDAVKTIRLTVATIKNGIAYKSVDSKPVFVVFMLLSPRNAASDNLKVLTSIAKLLRDNPNFLEKLIKSDTPSEFIELIAKEEMKI